MVHKILNETTSKQVAAKLSEEPKQGRPVGGFHFCFLRDSLSSPWACRWVCAAHNFPEPQPSCPPASLLQTPSELGNTQLNPAP